MTTALPYQGSRQASAADEAASRLSRLASDARFTPRRQDLSDLAGALRDEDDDSSPWTGLDLQAAFPPESSIQPADAGRLEHILGILAAVSVFFPIAWTWWSLHEASQAYAQMLADDSAAGQSFLQLWASGFGGQLPTIHYLTPVAMVSVMLIFFAVALIVSHRVASARANSRAHKTVVEAEAELSSALAFAQRVLNTRRAENPQDLERVIRVSVDRLVTANLETAQAADSLRAAAVVAAQGIEDSAGQITSSLGEIASTAEFMRESTRALQDATSQSQTALSAALGAFTSGVNQAVADYASATAASAASTTTQVQQASSGLQTAAAAAAQAQASVAQGVDRLAHALANFETDLGNSAGVATHSLADAVAASQSRLDRSIEEVARAIAGIDEALTATQSATQAQTTELTQARDAAERLLRHLESRTNVAQGRHP